MTIPIVLLYWAMHWGNLRSLWPYAHTAWGWTVAILSILLALYYGPRKMLETLDWYYDRFVDYKVRDFLHTSIRPAHITAFGERRATGIPKSLAEIAEKAGLSEKRATACLKRLQRKREVIPDGDGWKIVI